MCHSNFQRYQYSRGSDQQRICDCVTAQTGWWHALFMLRWLARCRDSRDEEWQRTTQQEGSANTQSGRYLRGEEALQEFFSVKMCFICVYRPVVKVKAITWTSPPALRNVPKHAIKFFLPTETSSFVEGFQKNLCASLGSMKSPIWILTQRVGPQNPVWSCWLWLTFHVNRHWAVTLKMTFVILYLSSVVNVYGRDVRKPKSLLESIRTPWPTFRGWVDGENS